jgi:hypothetical protein
MELTEEFNRDKVQRYTAHIIKMLDHCPNLHDLRLFPAYSTDLLYSVLGLDIAQIIEQGRWPSLKRLTLPMIGQFSPHSNDLLETFIGAHPNLEHLYFDDGIPPHSFVWTASLPNLKALHAGSNWDVGRIISPNIMRHLQFLSIVDLNSESRDENLRILAQIPTLRSLVVHLSFPSSELLDRLARAVPLIERLHFRSGTSPHFTETGIQTDQAEVCFPLDVRIPILLIVI